MKRDDDDETGGYGSLASWMQGRTCCPDCKKPQDGGWVCSECSEAEERRVRLREVEDGLRILTRSLPEQLKKFAGSDEARSIVREKKLLAVRDRYEPQHKNLLVIGPSGLGKTLVMIMAALRLANVARETTNAEHPICSSFWTSGLNLARALREQRLGSECAELEQARACRLLWLDEVGQELSDPRWLLDLLDSRYGTGRVTVTSSGLRRADLEARYGTGAMRRFTAPDGAVFDLFGDTA